MHVIKCDQFINGNILVTDTGYTAIRSITVNGITYSMTDVDMLNPVLVNAQLANNNLTNIIYVLVGLSFSFIVNQSTDNFQSILITTEFTGITPIDSTIDFSAKSNCKQVETAIIGCMDPAALNYDSSATEDSAMCVYSPVTDEEKSRCCIGSKEHELGMKIKYGIINRKHKDECLKKLLIQQAAQDALNDYIPLGTTIMEEVLPISEAPANVTFDLASVYFQYGFILIELTIDGGVVYSNGAATFYLTIAQLIALINANFPYGAGYTLSINGSLLTVTAPAGSGATNNGVILAITGHKQYFFTKTNINIVLSGSTTQGTAFGCYDPVSDQIIFGSYGQHSFFFIKNEVNVERINIGFLAGEVVYSPSTNRKYMGTYASPALIWKVDYILGANVLFPTPIILAAGEGVAHYGVFNPNDNKVYFTCLTGNADTGNRGSLAILDNSLPEGVTYFPLFTDSDPYEICVHPLLGVNLLYIAMQGLGGVCVYDPSLGTKTSVLIAGTAGFLKAIQIILVNGVYEIWTSASNIIYRRDAATPYAAIGSINFGVNVGIVSNIKQNSITGLVYISCNEADGGYIIIRPTDMAILSGTVLFPKKLIGGRGEGIVENMLTNEMYLSRPEPLGPLIDNPTPYPTVLVLGGVDEDVDFETVLSGGTDENDYSQDAVVTTESDNCLTPQQQEDLQTYLTENNCCEGC